MKKEKRKRRKGWEGDVKRKEVNRSDEKGKCEEGKKEKQENKERMVERCKWKADE